MSLCVVLRNISSLAPVSDYEYQVLIGDGTALRSKCIASGIVKEHTREDGWKALVMRVLEESK